MPDKVFVGGQSTGPSVDRQGTPVVDPSPNVKDLSEAAHKRQDDLRAADARYMIAEIAHVKEMASLRAEHAKEIRQLNDDRLEKIRIVDVNAVAVASERQSASASVLATQVAQSADALRTLVSTTASAMAEQNRQQTTQLTDRLTAVERSQYEGRGKESLSDPMIAEMVAEMKRMSAALHAGTGKGEGSRAMVGYIAIAISILVGLGTLAGLLLNR